MPRSSCLTDTDTIQFSLSSSSSGVIGVSFRAKPMIVTICSR